jgi:hypothetical protein
VLCDASLVAGKREEEEEDKEEREEEKKQAKQTQSPPPKPYVPPTKPKEQSKPLPSSKPIAPQVPDQSKVAKAMALMEEAKVLGWRPKDVVELVKKNFGVEKASLLNEEQFASLRELLITQEPPEVPSEI